MKLWQIINNKIYKANSYMGLFLKAPTWIKPGDEVELIGASMLKYRVKVLRNGNQFVCTSWDDIRVAEAYQLVNN